MPDTEAQLANEASFADTVTSIKAWPNYAVGAFLGGAVFVDGVIGVFNASEEASQEVQVSQSKEQALENQVIFYERLYDSVNNPNTIYSLRVFQPEGVLLTPHARLEDEEANQNFNAQYQKLKEVPAVDALIDDIKEKPPIESNVPLLAALDDARSTLSATEQQTRDLRSGLEILVPAFEAVIGGFAFAFAGFWAAKKVRHRAAVKKLEKQIVSEAEGHRSS